MSPAATMTTELVLEFGWDEEQPEATSAPSSATAEEIRTSDPCRIALIPRAGSRGAALQSDRSRRAHPARVSQCSLSLAACGIGGAPKESIGVV